MRPVADNTTKLHNFEDQPGRNTPGFRALYPSGLLPEEESLRVMADLRQSGKTTKLLEWVVEPTDEYRVIMVHSLAEARRIERELPKEFRSRLVSFEQVKRGEILEGIPNLVLGIDNLDLYLRRLIGFNVGAVTITSTPL